MKSVNREVIGFKCLWSGGVQMRSTRMRFDSRNVEKSFELHYWILYGTRLHEARSSECWRFSRLLQLSAQGNLKRLFSAVSSTNEHFRGGANLWHWQVSKPTRSVFLRAREPKKTPVVFHKSSSSSSRENVFESSCPSATCDDCTTTSNCAGQATKKLRKRRCLQGRKILADGIFEIQMVYSLKQIWATHSGIFCGISADFLKRFDTWWSWENLWTSARAK